MQDLTEEEQEELIEEDFLKEFLDHYDDYYQPVATRNVSFATFNATLFIETIVRFP